MFHQPMSSPWRMRMFGLPCLAIFNLLLVSLPISGQLSLLREKASAEADNHDLIRLSSALASANTPIRYGQILYFGTLPLDSIFHQLHSAHARRVSEIERSIYRSRNVGIVQRA